jgi:PAS domain S-box-containing protein
VVPPRFTIFGEAQFPIHTLQDDFDLNEIFAEYFINEFEDPMNAYTSSMANYSANAVPQALATAAQVDYSQQGEKKGMSLPTGGIKTAFHMGSNNPTHGVSEEPPAMKRLKQEETYHPGQPLIAPAIAGMGGMAIPAVASSNGSGVALPVGVGIRLGGLGGIAPNTAQAAVRSGGGGVQTPYTMWASGMGPGPGLAAVSEQAVAERRQRNREHAKRSRVRKKFMLESLQEEVRALQKENQNLRMLVQENIPDKAMQIINDCSTMSPLFKQGLDGEGGGMDDDPSSMFDRKETDLERGDFNLMQSLATGQKCFVLSDPKLPDNPIVFATQDFYNMTGYTAKEVLGRNCRFLQGPGTNQRAVEVIRKAVSTGSDCTVCLLNYKSDGTPFWNQLFVAALRDSDNCIVNYVSVEPVRMAMCLSSKG